MDSKDNGKNNNLKDSEQSTHYASSDSNLIAEQTATTEQVEQDFVVQNNENILSENAQSEKKGKLKSLNPFKIDKSLFTVEDESGKINLFVIAMPLFLQLIINNLLSMVNTAMFAHYDPVFITATNASNRILGFVSTLSVLVSMGLSINLAHAMGKNDKHEIENLPFNAIVLSLAFTTFMTAVVIGIAQPLLSIFHLKPQEMEIAVVHLTTNAPNVLIISSMITNFTMVLRCYGKTVVNVIVSLARVGLGVLFNALFINTSLGGDLHIVYKTTIFSYCSSIFLGLAAGIIETFARKIKFGRKLDFKLMLKIIRIGLPASVSSISYTLSSLLTTSIITIADSSMINIKVFVDSIVAFVSFLSSALGQSTSVMIGRTVGAGNYEKANMMHYSFMVAVVIINTILSLLVFIFHRQLFSIFDSSEQSLAIVMPIFAIDIVVEIGRALNHVEQFTLNGAGDVRYTTVISIISCWVCAVGGSYLFAVVCDLGIAGCYIAFALDELTRAFLYELRWRSGKWKKLKI